jgi:hypothetical protein
MQQRVFTSITGKGISPSSRAISFRIVLVVTGIGTAQLSRYSDPEVMKPPCSGCMMHVGKACRVGTLCTAARAWPITNPLLRSLKFAFYADCLTGSFWGWFTGERHLAVRFKLMDERWLKLTNPGFTKAE